MTSSIDPFEVCCVALELSKTSWVCAFAPPGDSKAVLHKIKTGEVSRLMGILNSSKAKAATMRSRTISPDNGSAYIAKDTGLPSTCFTA